jgi:hypothetical protein
VSDADVRAYVSRLWAEDWDSDEDAGYDAAAADQTCEIEIAHPVFGFLTLLMPWSEVKPLTLRWPPKPAAANRPEGESL